MKFKLHHVPIFAGIFTLGITMFVVSGGVKQSQDTRSKAADPTVGQLMLDPATRSTAINTEFPLTIKANVGATNSLNIVHLVITFDKTKLNAVSCLPANTYEGLFGQSPCTIDNPNGKVTVAIQTRSSNGPSNSVPLATIVMKGLTGGQVQVQFAAGSQLIVKDLSHPSPTPAESKSFTATTVTGSTITVQGAQTSPTSAPVTASSTPPAATPGPDDDILIPIGTTNSLTITIGGGAEATPYPEPTLDPNTPYIRFSTQLSAVENTPEITVRLKIVDLLSGLTPVPGNTNNSCHNPGNGQYFYTDIPLIADNGVYRPKPNGVFVYREGSYRVTEDGWVPLPGTSDDRAYAMYVKGPKHRDRRMVANLTLNTGKNASQNVDWTGTPLEPGDLPNPNQGREQDCTVNSIDLSLIISRLGGTEGEALDVADVNYDGIVNGNDIAKVVNTLSTKPDDD